MPVSCSNLPEPLFSNEFFDDWNSNNNNNYKKNPIDNSKVNKSDMLSNGIKLELLSLVHEAEKEG